MLLTNCYATLDEFKAKFFPAGAKDKVSDTQIMAVVESLSRVLDRAWDGRHWYPRTMTRHYTADAGDVCFVEDLLSVTTLKTDNDGDRTYETTWDTTDFDLEPYDAPQSAPPKPYTRISSTPNGRYRFPWLRKGVELAGSYGFYDCRRTATATANVIGSTTTTSVVVSDGKEFDPGMTLLIDSEQMHVQSKATKTLKVTRGVNGTTAATHLVGAAIAIYEYPTINEVILLMAGRLDQRKNAVFGVLGSAELGQMLVIAKQDPDVKLLMQPFRKAGI